MREKIKELLEKGILLTVGPEDAMTIHAEKSTAPLLHTADKKERTVPQGIEIIKSYAEKSTKKTIADFITTYNSRYLLIQSMLIQRRELDQAMSIRKCKISQEGEQIFFIAMVLEKNITHNNNVMLVLEDQTGSTKAVVTKNSQAYEAAKDLSVDEVVGVGGAVGKGIVFVNTLIQPDVPTTNETKKSPLDEAAVFISDIHIGSEVFLKKEFERFISWIRGDTTHPTQKELVSKIKYLFIIGDLVEGIGIFPGQEKELLIEDIYKQYAVFTEYIKKIPNHIKIIICPGNHDPVRIAEPQPTIPEELIPDLVSRENIVLVSSPSIVRISQTDKFKGIEVLLYHGFSFPYYASSIDSLRLGGGLEATENILEFLLKRRHLAPAHGSTQYQLGYEEDPLVISTIPDIIATGHVHRAAAKNYKGVTLLNCSCWISQTKYQERRGIHPQPGKAFYIDLKTRKTTMINF
ncbi:MAG: metallophosphoesterase [Nanoarchaeota archaeon]